MLFVGYFLSFLTIFKWQLLNDLRNFKKSCHSGWDTLSPCMHGTLCALCPVCIYCSVCKVSCTHSVLASAATSSGEALYIFLIMNLQVGNLTIQFCPQRLHFPYPGNGYCYDPRCWVN